MTKIVADCPHCKKESEIDIDKIEIKPVEIKQFENPRTTQAQATVQEVKPEIVEKIKEVLPSDIPAFKCKDGNCGRTHKNPNYKRAPKGKCTNCGQFSSDLEECKWCDGKEFEELEERDLQDMNIPLPEHNHEHEG